MLTGSNAMLTKNSRMIGFVMMHTEEILPVTHVIDNEKKRN